LHFIRSFYYKMFIKYRNDITRMKICDNIFIWYEREIILPYMIRQ